MFREPRLKQLAASIDLDLAKAAETRFSIDERKALLQPRINQINSEISRNKALTQTEVETLGLKKRQLEASISASGASAEAARANAALDRERLKGAELDRQIKGQMIKSLQGLEEKYKTPETPATTSVGTGSSLEQQLAALDKRAKFYREEASMYRKGLDDAGAARAEGLAINLEKQAQDLLEQRDKNLETARRAKIDEQEARSKIQATADKAEEVVISKLKGSTELKTHEISVFVDTFHANSSKNYWYRFKPNQWGFDKGDRYEPEKIPPVWSPSKNRWLQYDAKTLYERAVAKGYKDLQDYMEKEFLPKLTEE